MTGSARVRTGLFAVALVGALLTGLAASADSKRVDPESLDILRRMTDYLGNLERFSVETESMLEEVLDDREQKVQYDFTSRVVVQRPDRLRAERRGDLLDQLLVYDGRTLSIHDRVRGYFAVTEAPHDLDGLLHFARDTLDLVPPAGDIVYSNAFELLTGPLESGFVVGKSVVDGVRCDHLAFRNARVDWQIWIAEGDEPLPRKYVLTTRDDPERPQFLMLMREWDVSPKIRKKTFSFSPPTDAERIEFLRIKEEEDGVSGETPPQTGDAR